MMKSSRCNETPCAWIKFSKERGKKTLSDAGTSTTVQKSQLKNGHRDRPSPPYLMPGKSTSIPVNGKRCSPRKKRSSDEITVTPERRKVRIVKLRCSQPHFRNLMDGMANGIYPNGTLKKKNIPEGTKAAPECTKVWIVAPEPEVKPGRAKIENIDQKTTKRALEIKKISISHKRDAKRAVSYLQQLPENSALCKLKLRNCEITTKDLMMVLRVCEEKECKISTLNFSGNRNINLQVVNDLIKACQSDLLDLSETQLNAKQIEDLAEIHVKSLMLNYEAFNHKSITTTLTKMITHCLEELHLVDSKITDEQLLKIAEDVGNEIPLKTLDLSHVTLGPKGVKAVAILVNKTRGMKKLVLSDCGLSAELLGNLQGSIGKKISEFDISSNPGIALSDDVKFLATIASKVGCSEFDISDNALTDKHLRQLCASPPKKVRKLSICETPQVSVANIAELTKIWKILDLDASECGITSGEIVELASLLENNQLQRMDVTDSNEIMNEKRKEAFDQLRKKCKNCAQRVRDFM